MARDKHHGLTWSETNKELDQHPKYREAVPSENKTDSPKWSPTLDRPERARGEEILMLWSVWASLCLNRLYHQIFFKEKFYKICV